MNVKKQVRKLLLFEIISNISPAGAVWVLLLVGRGFTLSQVGWAEAVFHLVSLCCEVPSGILADVLGRRGAMTAGRLAAGISGAIMFFSKGMGSVCAAMVLSALGYNLSSGTREAITYESLCMAGREGDYIKLSALQNVLYRLSGALATLCAGWVAALGYRKGYALDVVLCFGGAALSWSLAEPDRGDLIPEGTFLHRLKTCAAEAWAFLKAQPKVRWVMLLNAAIGAAATLIRFYLQDGLPSVGAGAVLLGPLLLSVDLGGLIGSWAAQWLERLPYPAAGTLCALGQAVALGLMFWGNLPWLVFGGILAVCCDDAIQLVSDARINNIVPSGQRATLISVASMTFSLVMIVFCALAGAAL